MIACLPIRGHVLAIDGLGQDSGAGRLAYTPRPAKQEGVRQLLVLDGILQGSSDMCLTHDRREILRAIFSGRNDKFIHVAYS